MLRRLTCILVLAFVLVSASATARAEKSLYLLSEPAQVKVELGPIAKGVHYGVWVGGALLNGAAMYALTNNLFLAVPYGAAQLVSNIPYPMATSAVHLSFLQRGKTQGLLKRLADVPGVAAVKVLLTGSIEFSRLLAVRELKQGFVFVEADERLEAHFPSVKIADPDTTWLELKFSIAGIPNETELRLPVSAVLAGERLPEEVAAAWRQQIRLFREFRPWHLRGFMGSFEKSCLIEASLVNASGSQPLGVLAQGAAVKKLLGLTGLRRRAGAIPVRARFGTACEELLR
jgi:hypothetical protein